jgi:hypothetical protein
MYQELLKQGKTPKDAAREAQQRTGLSVVTGAPFKNRQLRKRKEGYIGQYK